MIIFKNKLTGEIIGKIDGRVHSEAQLKMTMGDPATTERIIIPWKVTKFVDLATGKEVKRKDIMRLRKEKRLIRAIRGPDHSDKQLFTDIERGRANLRDFKFNTKTGRLNKHKRPARKIEVLNFTPVNETLRKLKIKEIEGHLIKLDELKDKPDVRREYVKKAIGDAEPYLAELLQILKGADRKFA